MKFLKFIILNYILFLFPLGIKSQTPEQIKYCQSVYNDCVSQQQEGISITSRDCQVVQTECLECMRNRRYSMNCFLYTPPPALDPCFDEKPYNFPDMREGQGFDWKAREWKVYVKTDDTNNGTNGVLSHYPSPFYINEYNRPPYNIYPNNPSMYGLNLDIAEKPKNLDGHWEDGWLLLYHEIGKSITNSHERPLFVFYNKNKAIMRVFWLLGTRPEAYNKVQVELGYKGAEYRSNLLSLYQSPMPALEKGMNPNTSLKVANQYVNLNYQPYWVYAEFPMVYDPCGCEYESGRISLDLWGIQTYDINLTLKSQPYSPPSESVTPKADYGFMDFVNGASKLYKLTSGLAGSIGELNGGLKKTFGDSDLLALSQETFNTIGNYINLVPQAGGIVNATLAIVDFFTGGGNEKKQATKPTQVVLMNDFVGTGTMERKDNLAPTVNIQTPGSKHISTSSNMPYYDNPLGIMNLVNTPKVEFARGWEMRTENDMVNSLKLRLASKLDFVINPYLNIDVDKSDIQIALEIETKSEHIPENNIRGTNLDRVGRTLNGRYIFSSAYTPIACDVKENIWFISLGEDNGSQTVMMSDIITLLEPKISIKVVANLRKLNNTDRAKDIVYIAKYAVDLTEIGMLPRSYDVRPTSFHTVPIGTDFGDNPNNLFTEIIPKIIPNELSVGNKISINHLVYGQHDWKSGNSIELNPGAELSSQNVKWRHCYYLFQWFWWNYYCDDQYSYQEINISLSIDSTLRVNCYPAQKPVAMTKEQIRAFCKNQAGGVYYATHYNKPAPIEESAAQGKDINENVFVVYPNPASQIVTFSYETEEFTQGKIYVTDMMGTKIADISEFTQKEKGKYEVNADVGTWTNGIYLVVLETKTQKIVKKLVVTK